MDTNISKSAMLRHVDTMIMFLNAFPKGNISHVAVKKLQFLYNSLSDYLNQNVVKQGIKASKNPPVQSTSSSEDISYVCGICNEKIKIYNSDHSLSMSLHAQEDIHKKAINQQNGREKQHNVEKTTGSTDTAEQEEHRGSYIYKVSSLGAYYCRLCDVRLNGGKSCKQHEAGLLHQNNLSSTIQTQLAPGIEEEKDVNQQTKSNRQVKRIPEIVFNKSNAYVCNFCNISIGTSINNVIQHKYSRAHQENLEATDMRPISDQKFWKKMSRDARKQRIHFETVTDNTIFCKLCKVSVYRLVSSVKEHIDGMSHMSNFLDEVTHLLS